MDRSTKKEQVKFRTSLILFYVLIGTPVMLFLALVFMGGGHGTYDLGKLFFPGGMIVAEQHEQIISSAMVLTLAQNPVYGIILFLARKKGWNIALLSLLALHVILVVIVFNMSGPTFD